MEKNIYVVQIGTDSDRNLIPLSAGLIISRLKLEKELLEKCELKEIIFKREPPKEIVSKMEDVFVVGFSCYAWNFSHSMRIAKAVKEKFPNSLIAVGGPSIPWGEESGKEFLRENQFVDVVCISEGEETFVKICKNHIEEKGFENIRGIIYKSNSKDDIVYTGFGDPVILKNMPSPYLDGTFDNFYSKYKNDISGVIVETTRGCPYNCAYCAWCPGGEFSKLREISLERMRGEIKWIGENKINYVSIADSNFGVFEKDVEFIRLLAEVKKREGYPNFISVSWLKNSSERVLKMSEILNNAGIGFRITLSLQSLNPKVLTAINRINIKREEFERIRESFKKNRAYSYSELIFSLPEETKDSFLDGIEELMSDSIYSQTFIYPLFILPNTELAKPEIIKKYEITTKKVQIEYSRAKKEGSTREFMDMVVSTNTMPKKEWAETFVMTHFVLAMHDSRLAFFILNYLKKENKIKITKFAEYCWKTLKNEESSVIGQSLVKLKEKALRIQENGEEHLIKPEAFDISLEPSEGIFLDLLVNRERFFKELNSLVKSYLELKEIKFDENKLEDLFEFQKAVIAHPDGLLSEGIDLKYNWTDYFKYCFNLDKADLKREDIRVRVVDPKPSHGDKERFLKNYFNVRSVPGFNYLYNEHRERVFPL